MYYQGDLEVRDAAFSLTAERLAICPEENGTDSIIFIFSGYDDDGLFRTEEGRARQTEHGFYMAPRLRLDYHDYFEPDTASIKISQLLPNGNTCKISGEWIQGGETWKFDGELESNEPVQRPIKKKRKKDKTKQRMFLLGGNEYAILRSKRTEKDNFNFIYYSKAEKILICIREFKEAAFYLESFFVDVEVIGKEISEWIANVYDEFDEIERIIELDNNIYDVDGLLEDKRESLTDILDARPLDLFCNNIDYQNEIEERILSSLDEKIDKEIEKIRTLGYNVYYALIDAI